MEKISPEKEVDATRTKSTSQPWTTQWNPVKSSKNSFGNLKSMQNDASLLSIDFLEKPLQWMKKKPEKPRRIESKEKNPPERGKKWNSMKLRDALWWAPKSDHQRSSIAVGWATKSTTSTPSTSGQRATKEELGTGEGGSIDGPRG